MLIAGIDLGLRKAAVATYSLSAKGDVTLTDATALHVHPTVRGEELAYLARMVGQVTQECVYVWIEEPLVGRGVKASMGISQTCGAVLAELTKYDIHTELVNVKAWKKRMVGNGNASKLDVSLWLNAVYPLYADMCGRDQDLIDAAVIGLFGVDCIRTSQEMAESGLLPE